MVEQQRSLEPPNANQIIIHYTIRRWVRSGCKTLLVPNRPIVISVYLCMCMFIRCLNVHFVSCIRLNLWGQNKHVRTNLGYRSIGFYRLNFPKFLRAIYTRVTITYNHSIRNKNAPCVERGLKGWAGLAKGKKTGYHLNSMVRSWDLEWGNIMKHWGLMKHSDLMWWKLRIHGFWWVLYGFVQIWSITKIGLAIGSNCCFKILWFICQ